MDIPSKIWIIHKKSRDDVITTWPWFSSITLPGILAYQVRTKSDLQFRRYRVLKFAPLVWRHVTLDDVITTTRRGAWILRWSSKCMLSMKSIGSEIMTKVTCRKKTCVNLWGKKCKRKKKGKKKKKKKKKITKTIGVSLYAKHLKRKKKKVQTQRCFVLSCVRTVLNEVCELTKTYSWCTFKMTSHVTWWRNDVICTWPPFSSITLPGVPTYRGRTKSEVQFLEIRGPEVCTFKMTSRVTWWCHRDNKIIWQTSLDGHLSVCHVWSRSEIEKSQSDA